MQKINKQKLIEQAQPQIISFINNYNQQVLSIKDISKILKENKSKWALAPRTTTGAFLEFLLKKEILKEVYISTPYRTTIKYITKKANIYEIALSLNKGSYLSHYTALFLHNLTDNVPKIIYTNTEQSKKLIYKNDGELLQENIDQAFSRPMRKTTHIGKIEGYNIDVYLLNGKNVNKIGVINYLMDGREIPITNIERTLIDIVVRPDYAGGYEEVLNAYKAAKGKFSVNRLVATLKKMEFIYPYHQAIGFYMERAGYDENLLKLLEKIGIKYNFYLNYNIKEKCFSNRWKLYYPKGF